MEGAAALQLGAGRAPARALGFDHARRSRSDVVIAGPSSLDLWLQSSARDTDLQVTLSEVRPDGNETYVQNGWLRASHRKLDRSASTALDPVPDAPASATPRRCRAGASRSCACRSSRWRTRSAPGSRIRVTVQAPGGDRPRWDFATVDSGRDAQHDRRSAARARRSSCCR